MSSKHSTDKSHPADYSRSNSIFETMALPTNSLTTFLSLNALQCDQLAQLIMGSISYMQEDTDNFEIATEAIKLCEQTLNILQTIQIQIQTTNDKSNTKMKVSIKPNRLSSLPRDILFTACGYLDSFNKARLRFTSMTTHVDMMGCPLDLTQITMERHYDINEDKLRFRALVPLVSSCASMRIVKRQPRNLCGCDASRQLQLIDFRSTKVNQTLCNDLTESELSLLGIGPLWTITGIKFDEDDTTAKCVEACDVLSKSNHNAYQSVKRLQIRFSPGNLGIIDILNTDMVGCVEDLKIAFGGNFSLNSLLSSFKRLRRIDIECSTIDGSFNDFVKYCPQIEELILDDTDITGDISCLAGLKHIKKLKIETEAQNITGNISSLITLTKLEVLDLNETNVDGNIESLLKYLPKLKTLNLHNNSNLGDFILTDNIEIETLCVGGDFFSCNDRLDNFKSNNKWHFELSSLTQMKKLKNFEMCFMTNHKGDISAISSLIRLETFDLEDCPYVKCDIYVISGLTKLKSLSIGHCPQVKGDISMMSGLTKMESLSICHCPQVKGDISVMSSLTKLKSLRMIHCPQIKGDISVISGLIKLESLSIDFCPQVKGDISAISGLTKMESLSISHCPQVKGDISVMSSLTKLKSLTLNYCPQVTGSVNPLATLPNLKKLILNSLPNITGDAPLFSHLGNGFVGRW